MNTSPLNPQPERFIQLMRAWQCISQQSWLSMAFVFYWVWVNMAYQMPLAFPNVQITEGIYVPTRLMPISVSIVAYFFLSVWYRRSAGVIRQKWYPALLVSMMSAGTLLAVLWAVSESSAMYLLVTASFLSGVSSACLCIEMQRIFGQLGSQYVLFIGCFAMLLSSLLIYLLLLCPVSLQQVVWVVSPLPIALGVRQTVIRINAKGFYTHGIGTKLIIPYRFLITALLHGMTIGVTIGISLIFSSPDGSLPPIAISYALSALLLFVITVFFRLDYNHLIYRIGFPLAAFGSLLVTCVRDMPEVGLFIQLMGFCFLHLVMWGVCTYLIKNLKQPATWIIGTSTCAFMSGQLLGGIVSTLVDNLSHTGQSMQAIAPVMMFAFLFVSLLLTSGRNVKTGWGLAKFGSNELSGSDKEQAIVDLTLEFNLTKRECDTLALLVRGKSRKAIGEELVISEETVKSHSSSIYNKLAVHSQQELISLFDKRRLNIKLEEPRTRTTGARADAEQTTINDA